MEVYCNGCSSASNTSKSRSTQAVLDPKVEETRSGYVFFWKPEGAEGIYSQWDEHPFVGTVPSASTPGTEETVTYPTAEHYMMAHKALLFKDYEVMWQILGNGKPEDAPDAKQTKALGRLVSNFDEKTWVDNRLRIVEEGNWLKFTQNPDLKATLLATGERVLVEASPLDRIWGVGFGAQKAPYQKARWGLNLLGVALMNVRKRLNEEASKASSSS